MRSGRRRRSVNRAFAAVMARRLAKTDDDFA